MSNIYHTEPPTQGKVVLTTSLGEIDIELWSKEAPLACRNFIQLCLEGYYDNCLFHRVIKDFMAQTGDPTGTGTGGESIWGKPFKDEIHGRLKFNHRGIVAMANESKPNTNHSQFFVTLGSCEWLNKKHTIFGKVTGNTVFNLLRFSDVECGERDEPLEEIRVRKTEVLWNPFDDIIPRTRSSVAPPPPLPASLMKGSKKGVRSIQLLSFGEEEEEPNGRGKEEREMEEKESQSNYKKEGSQLADKSRQLKKENEVQRGERQRERGREEEDGQREEGDQRGEKRGREDPNKRQKESSREGLLEGREERERNVGIHRDREMTRMLSEAERDGRKEILNRQREEFERMRRDLKKARGQDSEEISKSDQHESSSSLSSDQSALDIRKSKVLRMKARAKQASGDRQQQTLDRLKNFSFALKQTKEQARDLPQSKMKEGEVYHGQVLEEGSDDEGEVVGVGWHLGKLKFRKHIDDQYRQAGTDDNYLVLDTKKTRK